MYRLIWSFPCHPWSNSAPENADVPATAEVALLVREAVSDTSDNKKWVPWAESGLGWCFSMFLSSWRTKPLMFYGFYGCCSGIQYLNEYDIIGLETWGWYTSFMKNTPLIWCFLRWLREALSIYHPYFLAASFLTKTVHWVDATIFWWLAKVPRLIF